MTTANDLGVTPHADDLHPIFKGIQNGELPQKDEGEGEQKKPELATEDDA